MIERQGNLLDTDIPAIAHGVNCQGLMGAGVAKAIRAKFPDIYPPYFVACEAHRLKPGELQEFHTGVSPIQLVYNVATQFRPGRDAQYAYVLYGMMQVAHSAVAYNYPQVAIPQIGCGIGGLSWEPEGGNLGVKYYLQRIEFLTGIEWVVYTL